MSPEIRRYLKSEVDRLQKLRFECDRRLRIAWGIGCHACGGDADEVTVGCKPCQERARSRQRRRDAEGVVLPPGDHRHGTVGYNTYRCRCGICMTAKQTHDRQTRERRQLRAVTT